MTAEPAPRPDPHPPGWLHRLREVREHGDRRATADLVQALLTGLLDDDLHDEVTDTLCVLEDLRCERALTDALLDGREARRVRESALRVLSCLPCDDPSTLRIAAWLDDPDPLVRAHGATFLAPRDEERLAALMRDPAVEVRRAAVESLVTAVRTPLLVEALCGALRDPDPTVREVACRAALFDEPLAATYHLLHLLADPDPDVRCSVYDALEDYPCVAVLLALADARSGPEGELAAVTLSLLVARITAALVKSDDVAIERILRWVAPARWVIDEDWRGLGVPTADLEDDDEFEDEAWDDDAIAGDAVGWEPGDRDGGGWDDGNWDDGNWDDGNWDARAQDSGGEAWETTAWDAHPASDSMLSLPPAAGSDALAPPSRRGESAGGAGVVDGDEPSERAVVATGADDEGPRSPVDLLLARRVLLDPNGPPVEQRDLLVARDWGATGAAGLELLVALIDTPAWSLRHGTAVALFDLVRNSVAGARAALLRLAGDVEPVVRRIGLHTLTHVRDPRVLAIAHATLADPAARHLAGDAALQAVVLMDEPAVVEATLRAELMTQPDRDGVCLGAIRLVERMQLRVLAPELRSVAERPVVAGVSTHVAALQALRGLGETSGVSLDHLEGVDHLDVQVELGAWGWHGPRYG